MNGPPTKRTWEQKAPRVGRRFVLCERGYVPEIIVFSTYDKKVLAGMNWSSTVVLS